MILALDCATKTGWCLMKNGKVYESGVQDFSKTRGESNGAMFLRFRNWLIQMLRKAYELEGNSQEPEKGGIKLIVYEQTHHRGGAATHIAENLVGRVEEICDDYGPEYVAVHSATLKKFATGSGRADKAKMMELAKAMLGRDPQDDNEADAVHLAAWAFYNYGVK